MKAGLVAAVEDRRPGTYSRRRRAVGLVLKISSNLEHDLVPSTSNLTYTMLVGL